MSELGVLFQKAIYYIENISIKNNIKLKNEIKEQRENLYKLECILQEFEVFTETLKSCEPIESDATLAKLMVIHKFTTDLEWYASEINDLNLKVIKTCSKRRESIPN